MRYTCDWCGHEFRSGEQLRIQVICAPCVPEARFEECDFEDVPFPEELDDFDPPDLPLPDEPWPDIDIEDIGPPPWEDDLPFR